MIRWTHQLRCYANVSPTNSWPTSIVVKACDLKIGLTMLIWGGYWKIYFSVRIISTILFLTGWYDRIWFWDVWKGISHSIGLENKFCYIGMLVHWVSNAHLFPDSACCPNGAEQTDWNEDVFSQWTCWTGHCVQQFHIKSIQMHFT